MTGLDHVQNSAVELAAEWLSQTSERPRPLVPDLQRRFHLTALEACEAIALSRHALWIIPEACHD